MSDIKIRPHYQNLTDENIDRLIKRWEGAKQKIYNQYIWEEGTTTVIKMYDKMIIELRTLKYANKI